MLSIFNFFQNFPFAFQCTMAFFGLCVGSFLNVVIARLPRKLLNDTSGPMLVWSPRSECPDCHHPIFVRDNIPVLSYCLLKGRCRHCNVHISARYPLIEILTTLLSFIVAAQLGVTIAALLGLILTWTLIALAFIDMDHMLLPDDITLPMIWLGLFCSLFSVFQDSHSAILGAMLGYLSLWTVYWIFKFITGKEGMGFGDFKLLAMLGAWLGWQSLPFIILFSSLLGTLVGLSLIFFKKSSKNYPLPFGPHLALAGFMALLWNQDLMTIYFRVMNG